MSYEICEKARNLEPYEPVSGDYKIRLDANESFINLPKQLTDKITKEIAKIDFNRYPDAKFTSLIFAYCERYNVNKENVTAGNGSDELITVILNGLTQKGEKILTLEPDFSMYRHNGCICELECLTYKKDENFKVDMKEVCKTINENNISLFIFSNPCNPTGGLISKKDIEYLLDNTNALIVVDEAYMEFSDSQNSLLNEVENYDNLIVLKTLSKAIGLAGIRLGFCVSNKKIIKAINALRSPYNINVMTQKVGQIILKEATFLDTSIENIKESRKILLDSFQKQKFSSVEKIYEANANFIFLKVKDGTKIKNYLKENKIAIRQFGDYLRITAGSKEENQILLNILKQYKN